MIRARSGWGSSIVLGLMLLTGCPSGGGGGGGGAPPSGFQQRLVLDVDGMLVAFSLERLNVYLVEDESFPERFELAGAGVTLVGSFPVSLHVGYEEAFGVLVGQQIPILPEEQLDEVKKSTITLPGGAAVGVKAGKLTVRRVLGESLDAKVPLEGEIELELEDGRALRGTLTVFGTTWG